MTYIKLMESSSDEQPHIEVPLNEYFLLLTIADNIEQYETLAKLSQGIKKQLPIIEEMFNKHLES